MKTIGKSFLAGMLLPAVCICMNAIPQAEDFDVRHIGYAEGLSSQRVFSIVEDRNSAMWFSTKEGIDRYNGREVSNYTLPGDLYYGDKAGMRIWLQCDAGGKLWAYIHTGRIYRYSESGDCFELVIDLKKLIEGEIILNCLHVCDDGEMWAGLGSGLYRISENGDITRTVSDHYINCIIPVGNMIYAGASDGSAVLFHTEAGITEEMKSTVSLETTLWSGHFLVDDWKVNFTEVKKDQFADIEAGSVLRVYYSLNTAAEYHQIRTTTTWWNDLPGTAQTDLTADGVFTVTLTQEALDMIQTQDGFICVGHGYYVDRVTVE